MYIFTFAYSNLKGSTSVIISSCTDDEQLTPTPDESKPVNKNPEEIQDKLPENKNDPVEITTVVGCKTVAARTTLHS